jgi:5,10-methylenetetrahydromethanopterin reductase
MLDGVRGAETAGVDSVWFAQHMGYREAVVWATAAASVTKSVRLVPAAISPYLWPPLPIAMSMATLADFSGGRVGLCVSVGNVLNLAESGVEPVKPVKVMREYVEALRAFRSGKPVHDEGEIHQLRGARMIASHDAEYPIYVASTGPQVLKLSGQIADGVLLSGGLTLESIRRCMDAAAEGLQSAGRDPNGFRNAAFINFAVSKDGHEAKALMLQKLAYLFRSKGHAENVRSANLGIDHQAIMDAFARHDADAATRLLPEEAATRFAVSGTPDECRELLTRYLAMGLDEPILEISGDAAQRRLALDVIRDVVRETGGLALQA